MAAGLPAWSPDDQRSSASLSKTQGPGLKVLRCLPESSAWRTPTAPPPGALDANAIESSAAKLPRAGWPTTTEPRWRCRRGAYVESASPGVNDGQPPSTVASQLRPATRTGELRVVERSTPPARRSARACQVWAWFSPGRGMNGCADRRTATTVPRRATPSQQTTYPSPLVSFAQRTGEGAPMLDLVASHWSYKLSKV